MDQLASCSIRYSSSPRNCNGTASQAEVTSDVVGYGDTEESGYVLNSLSITRGSGTEVELYPAFSADTQSYTATVTHYDNTTNTVQPDKLIFRAIPAAEDAVVTLNYTNNYTSVPVSVVLDHTGAAATADYCLRNGVNEFTITVAPPEGRKELHIRISLR